MNRRGFLGSILAACAAPAIVRADSLMRIVPLDLAIFCGGEIHSSWPPVDLVMVTDYLTKNEIHRLYNYGRSTYMERIALTPKSPFFMVHRP